MTDPAAIRAGLVAALSTAAFTAEGFQAQEYFSVPLSNVIQFMPEPFGYFPTEEQTWAVEAFVAANFDKLAQMKLDKLLASTGDLSIKAALEADDTLGGRCSELKVIESKGHQFFESPQGLVLGSTWTVHLFPN